MPTAATIFTHWKSTAQGVLVMIVTTCQVLSASNMLNGKAANIASLVSALAFAYIGVISKDSGVVVAQVGTAAPKAVPSTEVPLDPKATVITGKNV